MYVCIVGKSRSCELIIKLLCVKGDVSNTRELTFCFFVILLLLLFLFCNNAYIIIIYTHSCSVRTSSARTDNDKESKYVKGYRGDTNEMNIYAIQSIIIKGVKN